MDEGCVWFIVILIVVAIAIALIVYVILPATLIIVGSITLAGTASGVYVAGKNFGELMLEAHKTVK